MTFFSLKQAIDRSLKDLTLITRHIARFGPLRQLDVNLPFDAVVVVDGVVVVVVVVVVVDVVVVVVLLVVVGRVRSFPDLVGTTHDHQQRLYESNFNPKRHLHSIVRPVLRTQLCN